MKLTKENILDKIYLKYIFIKYINILYKIYTDYLDKKDYRNQELPGKRQETNITNLDRRKDKGTQ